MSTAIQPSAAGVERYEPQLPTGVTALEAPVRTVTLLEDRAQVSRQGTVRVTRRAEPHHGAGRGAGAAGRVPARRGPLAARPAWRTSASAGACASAPRTSPRRRASSRSAWRRCRREREQVLEDQARAAERFERIAADAGPGRRGDPRGRRLGHRHGGSQWQDSLRGAVPQGPPAARVGAAGHLHRRAAGGGDLPRCCASARRWTGWTTRWCPGWRRTCSPSADGEVEVRIDYVVPNALWRPLHTARLLGGSRVQFTSSAAVWQDTGEDWKDVELRFSTARSSLGTEPPLLRQDLLTVKKKNETVLVQARQVQVQKAGLGSAPAAGGARPPAHWRGSARRGRRRRDAQPARAREELHPLGRAAQRHSRCSPSRTTRRVGAGVLPGAGDQGVPPGGGAQHLHQPGAGGAGGAARRTTASWAGRRRCSWRPRRSSS